MKTILVTGGLGFIGWNLSLALAEKGYRVVSYDKKSFPNRLPEVENLTVIAPHNTNEIEQHNIKADYIFHLGEFARVEPSLLKENAFDVINSNYRGTGSVFLNYILNNPDAYFFYAGSSTRFSSKSGYQQSPYACTKYMNAEFTKLMAIWFGLKTSVLYFYNVFGEGENDGDNKGTVIGKFMKKWQNGDPITVYGGSQSRRFTYIGDVVRNIVEIVDGVENNGESPAREIHLVSENVRERTISDIARMFYDDKMIRWEEKKPGCRDCSIEDKGLKSVNTLGSYDTSVEDYIKKEKIYGMDDTEKVILDIV